MSRAFNGAWIHVHKIIRKASECDMCSELVSDSDLYECENCNQHVCDDCMRDSHGERETGYRGEIDDDDHVYGTGLQHPMQAGGPICPECVNEHLEDVEDTGEGEGIQLTDTENEEMAQFMALYEPLRQRPDNESPPRGPAIGTEEWRLKNASSDSIDAFNTAWYLLKG